MIINRYLLRETALPLAIVTLVLVIIFMSYNAGRLTTDAAAGLLPASTVTYLTLLKSLIAIEVLLPIALYLSVVMGIGRLNSDLEIIALHASGISEMKVVRIVLRLSLIVALIVAGLSLAIRPWAYHQSYLLKAEAEAEFNLDKLEPGQFYAAEESGTVIYVEQINREENRLEDVHFFQVDEDQVLVVQAKQAWQPVIDPYAPPVLRFSYGSSYRIDLAGTLDLNLFFKDFSVFLRANHEKLLGHKSKATKTLELFGSDKPKDLAELQWRLITPITTLLLGILAVPLSRAAPRTGRYAKAVVAAIVYAVFYNLSVVAKNWVEQGLVGPIPGLWWPNAILAILVVVLLLNPRLGSGMK